ncbi:MAG: glycosyltransferase family 39 protein [Candidatus Omnitrophota bacterium]|nr:glycosyltransferase family 39 protein [Candidatus Omnitrophota bacterium]
MLYIGEFAKTAIYPFLPYSDSYSYFCWAKDIAGGQIWGAAAFMKWPLYAYFLAFLFKLFGANLALIYAFQFILGALNCILVYLIARIIFESRTAFFAGIFCACYGLFIFYEGLLVYSGLSVFLNSLFFLWLLNSNKNFSYSGLFFAGLLLGICTVTQANAAIFGILAVCWVLWSGKQKFRQLAVKFSVFLLGLSMVIGSATLLNYLAEKDFVLLAGNTGFNFYSGNHPQAEGSFFCPKGVTRNQEDMFRDSRIIARAESGRNLKTSGVSRFWFNRAGKNFRENPARHLKLIFKKIALLFSPAEPIHDIEFEFIKDRIGIFRVVFMDLRFILPLAFLGMILAGKNFRQAFLLYLAIVVYALSIVMFFVTARYRLALVPFLAIFSGCAVSRLIDACKERNYFRCGLLGAVLIAFFALLNIKARDKPVLNPQAAIEYYLIRAAIDEGNADYQSAMRLLQAAYGIEPSNYRVLTRMGVVNYNLHKLKEAEEKFKQVIKLCPFCVDAYYNLGFIYNQEKRFSEARPMLERAISLDPENIPAHFEMAMVYKQEANFAQARKELQFVLWRLSRWRLQDRNAAEEELRELPE